MEEGGANINAYGKHQAYSSVPEHQNTWPTLCEGIDVTSK